MTVVAPLSQFVPVMFLQRPSVQWYLYPNDALFQRAEFHQYLAPWQEAHLAMFHPDFRRQDEPQDPQVY